MVRAPGDKKLDLKVDMSKTVLDLKEQIAALDHFKDDPCEPATQRLIFSGRVLKVRVCSCLFCKYRRSYS